MPTVPTQDAAPWIIPGRWTLGRWRWQGRCGCQGRRGLGQCARMA